MQASVFYEKSDGGNSRGKAAARLYSEKPLRQSHSCLFVCKENFKKTHQSSAGTELCHCRLKRGLRGAHRLLHEPGQWYMSLSLPVRLFFHLSSKCNIFLQKKNEADVRTLLLSVAFIRQWPFTLPWVTDLRRGRSWSQDPTFFMTFTSTVSRCFQKTFHNTLLVTTAQ